jgi:hypothetical protein
MPSVSFDRLKHISGKRTSAGRELFLDMVNNPQNYKGYIVYLKEIDEDEIYQPFAEPKKFYLNEGGQWQTKDTYGIPFAEWEE